MRAALTDIIENGLGYHLSWTGQKKTISFHTSKVADALIGIYNNYNTLNITEFVSILCIMIISLAIMIR